MRKSIFSKRFIDENNEEIGFVQNNRIYLYDKDSKSYGTFWLKFKRMPKGSEKRYVLFKEDETIPYAYLGKYSNVFSIQNDEYIGTIEYGFFLLFLLVFAIITFIITALSGVFTGVTLFNTVDKTSVVDVYSLTVSDNETHWLKDTPIDIFGVKDTNKKIRPGSKGTYFFKVKNDNTKNAIYNISFAEANKYKVPMRFKLRENGHYIAGSSTKWCTLDELHVVDKHIGSMKKNEYILDWIWYEENDKHDTSIGVLDHADYSMRIEVNYGLLK